MVAIEVGSANVYAALGNTNSAEMQRKATLAAKIARAFKARRLTQATAVDLLGIDQTKIPVVSCGQFRGVSEVKMLEPVAKPYA